MTDIIKALYLMAAEKNFHPHMNLQEYIFYSRSEERTEASILQLLPQEQHELLEKLRQTRNNLITVEQEAAFQAGLAIGLE